MLTDDILSKFKDSVVNCNYKLREVERTKIVRQLEASNSNLIINFINFNYTYVLGKVLSKFDNKTHFSRN